MPAAPPLSTGHEVADGESELQTREQDKAGQGRGQFSTLKARPQLLCHVHKLSYRVLMLY